MNREIGKIRCWKGFSRRGMMGPAVVAVSVRVPVRPRAMEPALMKQPMPPILTLPAPGMLGSAFLIRVARTTLAPSTSHFAASRCLMMSPHFRRALLPGSRRHKPLGGASSWPLRAAHCSRRQHEWAPAQLALGRVHGVCEAGFQVRVAANHLGSVLDDELDGLRCGRAARAQEVDSRRLELASGPRQLPAASARRPNSSSSRRKPR